MTQYLWNVIFFGKELGMKVSGSNVYSALAKVLSELPPGVEARDISGIIAVKEVK